jgi:transposase
MPGRDPRGYWKTTTVTASLKLGGISAPMVLHGPMNGEVFKAYVEQVLVHELASGDIVVMDNLPAHKVTGIRDVIEAVGASLLYLRPYSPDFNPMEIAFANSRRFCGPLQHEPFRIYGKRSHLP